MGQCVIFLRINNCLWPIIWEFDISNSMMTINEAPLERRLSITSFNDDYSAGISDIESRLMHLGFIHGATIEIKKKAPFFKEPLLVEVRGRLVALSRSEAGLVRVEVSE